MFASSSSHLLRQKGAEQIIIQHRTTEQTMVVSDEAYLANRNTAYRNWRLYGNARFVDVPMVISAFLPVQMVSSGRLKKRALPDD